MPDSGGEHVDGGDEDAGIIVEVLLEVATKTNDGLGRISMTMDRHHRTSSIALSIRWELSSGLFRRSVFIQRSGDAFASNCLNNSTSSSFVLLVLSSFLLLLNLTSSCVTSNVYIAECLLLLSSSNYSSLCEHPIASLIHATIYLTSSSETYGPAGRQKPTLNKSSSTPFV